MKAVIIPKITIELPGFHLKSVRNQPFLQGLALTDPILGESTFYLGQTSLMRLCCQENAQMTALSMLGKLCLDGLFEAGVFLALHCCKHIGVCTLEQPMSLPMTYYRHSGKQKKCHQTSSNTWMRNNRPWITSNRHIAEIKRVGTLCIYP